MQECQIQIWVKPNEPLSQKAWVTEGFASLADYVESLRLESERGYRGNGKPKDSGKNLPLVSFGFYDGGKKKVVMVCPTVDDLPKKDLKYGDYEIVTFN